jgi:GntR family carbon starvation induced transcriptional regulator
MKKVSQSAPLLTLVGGTRSNDVWHRLREDVLSGVLLPGQRLHFENLKAVYGVSFGTIREALSRLTTERLLVADAQRGFTVAPISIDDMLDVTRVRVMVESEALSSSIKNGDQAWRSAVLRAFHDLDRFSVDERPNSTAWSSAHRAFHASLVSASDSKVLKDISADLFDRASRYRRLSMVQRAYRREKSIQHRELMEAALTGSVKEAVKLFHDHIWETTNNVVSAMKAASEPVATPAKRSRVRKASGQMRA